MTLKHRLGNFLIPHLPLNRRTLNGFRFELNALITSLLVRLSPRLRRIRADIAAQQHLRVNLGSGGSGQADWVNIDIGRNHKDQTLPWDIRRGLPFSDNQVAMLFAEHVIEHIEFREDVPRLMRDIYRVLEPGGWLRIIVPDGERWLCAYVSQDPQAWANLGMSTLPSDMPTPMTMINHIFHQDGEHFFAYDFETLAHVLRQAGFTKIQKMAWGHSALEALCLDQPHHAPYSLYVEAQK